ncbi:hypothetical protein CVV68_03160 [Arthrobacter livingstonensis]|uniref:Uncharacterized protein n=1 Tax=Arthrobacter livingstonensis TaxID=670078 RepID=A0A2V5LZE6_9MICC|nr:hypothetical protein [Arthrobacter livingstonensis]PYI69407.1 hypothetical protein CVV68_03160 [Arthrobacter livingstonensis]
MLKMISQASALALGLVTVVLGVVALVGHAELWPFVIGAAVITAALVVVALVGKRKSALGK